jgi:flagellar hook-associated protein 3 FlgL
MLRVSTYNLYQTAEQNIVNAQATMMSTQTQLSTGKRINSPADDPVGTANAAMLQSGVDQLGQFQSNVSQATYLLNAGQSTMSDFINVLQDVRQRLVQAGDRSYDDSQRGALATALQQDLQQLVGLANTGDGQGGYLFGGSRTAGSPFSMNGNQVAYVGDNVLQGLQISPSRTEQVKYSGQDAFMSIPAGNGTFVTAAAAGNTGSGSIDAGSVVSPSALTGDSYAVNFAVAGTTTTYQVVDTTTSAVVQNGTYGGGPTTLGFGGMQVTISGSPANNDSFTVKPAGNSSVFDTVAAAVAALQTPASTPSGSGQLSSSLASLLASTDQALSHISIKQADMGSQLSELTTYTSLNGERTLQYKSQMSSIVDLDYAKGASDLARQQMSYQAALQSYSAVSKLSLFAYL